MGDFPIIKLYLPPHALLKLKLSALRFVDALRDHGHRRSCGHRRPPPETFEAPPYTLILATRIPRTVCQTQPSVTRSPHLAAIAHGHIWSLLKMTSRPKFSSHNLYHPQRVQRHYTDCMRHPARFMRPFRRLCGFREL